MYSTGKIEVLWDSSYKSFNYTKQPISQEETDLWASLGYDYVKSFTGSMYNNRNPMPDWISKINKLFELKNQTYTFYKMTTLDIMPVHVDHFNTYSRLFKADTSKICRVLIMLEDWKSGHYLEIDNKAFVNWSAGDYFLWSYDTPHSASNIGIEDRYTLQITGELD